MSYARGRRRSFEDMQQGNLTQTQGPGQPFWSWGLEDGQVTFGVAGEWERGGTSEEERACVSSKSLDTVCEEFAFEELKEPKELIISGKRGREGGC